MSFLTFFLLSLLLLHHHHHHHHLITASTLSPPSTPIVGVTISTNPNTTTATTPPLPHPDRICKTLTTLKIPSIRLPNPTPTLIRTFLYTNTSLFLSLPNSLIPTLASNRSNALRWAYEYVVPFYPRARITTISVGNNALDANPDYAELILPAIRNLHSSLRELGIRHISVSTTFSFVNIMTTSFPPSSATFQEPFLDVLMRPLLDFLDDTNSSFLINIYPYNLYRLRCEVPLGFALFQEHAFMYRDDTTTGVRYWNLFDMMVDAVIAAMAVAGHEDIPVIVAETGWPGSSTDGTEVDATETYAGMYLKGLIRHLRSGLGTPLRKEGVKEAYVYELVDEDGKNHVRNWGILYPNLTEKYGVQFSGANSTGSNHDYIVLQATCLWLVWYIQVLLDF